MNGLALTFFSVLLSALYQAQGKRSQRHTYSPTFVSCLHHRLFLFITLAIGGQSCAQGFQPWETLNASGRTSRNRQYIFSSLNFSCDGFITGWVLQRYDLEDDDRPNRGRVLAGEAIALQLWRQKAGTELIYTLQNEQIHTARTENAPSYSFTVSSLVTVTAGDVFGFYVPNGTGEGGGLRVATTSLSEHTVFASSGAPLIEISVGSAGSQRYPLISIEFSKPLQ